MKIIKDKQRIKIYEVGYWILHFVGDEDLGYDFHTIEVQAISPKQAVLKAKQKAPRWAK